MPTPSNPFEDVERLFERMSRSFEESGLDAVSVREPPVDVVDGDGEVVVAVDLPGYDKEDVTVSVTERDLTVEAERERETETAEERYVRRERTHSRVSRTVRLPADVDETAATAAYDNGVLTVRLPKRVDEGDDSHSIDID